jgi:hypothetical protein
MQARVPAQHKTPGFDCGTSRLKMRDCGFATRTYLVGVDCLPAPPMLANAPRMSLGCLNPGFGDGQTGCRWSGHWLLETQTAAWVRSGSSDKRLE